MGDQDRDVDCSNAARGVWLVKVPKYIASRWSKAPPLFEAGRLKITKGANGESDIRFTLSDECVNMKDPADKSSIPKEHHFIISNIANQNLAVFAQNKVAEDGTEHSSGKVYLEGHVVQKGECRPLGDDHYMQLKRQTILKASQHVRQVKQLNRIVQNYKPVGEPCVQSTSQDSHPFVREPQGIVAC
nr:LOW QUALITY PROTEIN: general transcription factor IIF subunit 2-like [Rhipicephalus microplus]